MARRRRRPWSRELKLTLGFVGLLAAAGWAGPIWVWSAALGHPETLTFGRAAAVAAFALLGAAGGLTFVWRTQRQPKFVRCWFLLLSTSAVSSFLSFAAFNLVAARFGAGRILPVCLAFLIVTIVTASTAVLVVTRARRPPSRKRRVRITWRHWLSWGVLAAMGAMLVVMGVGQFVPSAEANCLVSSNEHIRTPGARHAGYQQRVESSCGSFRISKDSLRGHFWDVQVREAIQVGESYDFALTGLGRRNIVAATPAGERQFPGPAR